MKKARGMMEKAREAIMNRIELYVPAGVDYRQEVKWIKNGLIASFLFSLVFFINLSNCYSELFYWEGGEKILAEGAVMPDFVEILGMSLGGFLIVALGMGTVLVYHYLYHFQGSKSIYLMKRLPDRLELWKRCLILPVTAAGLCLFLAVLLLVVYLGIYLLVTPEVCLSPNQWYKIGVAYLGVL